MKGLIPDEITKCHCVGKIPEMFDPLGRVAPLVNDMRLGINELTPCKLDWDESILCVI